MLDQVHSLADELQSFFQQEARRKLSRTKALEFCAKAYGFPTYNHVPKRSSDASELQAVSAAVGEQEVSRPVNAPASMGFVGTAIVNQSGESVQEGVTSADQDPALFPGRLFRRLKELSQTAGVHKIRVKLVGRPLCVVLSGGPDGAFGDYSLQFWESEDGPLFYSHGDVGSIDEQVVAAFLRKGVLAAIDIWPEIKTISRLHVRSSDISSSPGLSLSPRHYIGEHMAKNSFEFID